MQAKAKTILVSASDAVVSDLVFDAFQEVERNYFLRSWKTSELDAGHFVEAVRRFIDFRLFGAYIPVGKTLSNFNDVEIKRLEKGVGSESYRIHIPRALLFVYGLRNKRGVGHLSLVSPNYMDATVVVGTCKWVLAEILRLESKLTSDQTSALVEQIVDRPVPGVWNAGAIKRVLESKLSLRAQILFLLLDQSPQAESQLATSTDSKNLVYFRKILRGLHAKRLIEYSPDGLCTISPNGYKEAEHIALESKQ